MALRFIGLLACCAWLASCASLPSLEGRERTFALTDTADAALGRAIAGRVAANPAKTGVHAMPSPTDAFAARMVLAMTAERSLDLQYYIWHDDQTGLLLLEQVWRAADRGVRVRLLLDDATTAGLDDLIGTLAAHANIEVRLYNPLLLRKARALELITDFARLNRRMHNKSFVADNQVAIVGGRNIGNEYFGAGDDVTFRDLDVIVVGAVVGEVSAAFDLYWNSASAYPARTIVDEPAPGAAARLEARFAAMRGDPQALRYAAPVRQTPLLAQLMDGKLELEWAQARLVRDDPAKTLDDSGRTDLLLLPALLQIAGRPQASFDLVSPYFVPGEQGTRDLVALARRGTRVRVLTNSLAGTDVAVVHAGYAKRRCELLEAGVQLFELRPQRQAVDNDDDDGKPRLGSSAATSLHAKTFAGDRNRIFVGSFNFDPRSAHLNTEMGLVIESSALATTLSNAFDKMIPQLAYEAHLTAAGRCLEWIERTPAGEIRHAVEPGTRASQRALVNLLAPLPIDWLL